MYPGRPAANVQRFFAGLTEFAFGSRLGVADPSLVDYIAGLLARFVHSDAIFSVRGPTGTRLDQVTAMMAEADLRIGDARREVHRHIGDFTLFWTGVYPEALARMQSANRADAFFDYRELGKRAYFIASTLRNDENAEECEVLERLSHDFELCQYGLGEVRREWERRDADGERPGPLLFN